MNQKRLIIIVVVLVLILVVLYVYKLKTSFLPKVDTTPSPNPGGASTPTSNDSFPLKQGSKGDNVKYLQKAINHINPSANLVVDGSFGPTTYQQLLLTIGASYYPVSQAQWTFILNKSNSLAPLTASSTQPVTPSLTATPTFTYP